MPTDQTPKRVELSPQGLYETPAAEAFESLTVDPETGLIRVRFLLQGGSLLDVVLAPHVVERLRAELNDYPDAPNWDQIGE